MRAAWGALKGAVQELNDALLEEDDGYVVNRRDQHQEHASYPGDRSNQAANDHYISNSSRQNANLGFKGNPYSNNNGGRGVFNSDSVDDSTGLTSSLNGKANVEVKGTLFSSNTQHSMQSIIMFQDSEDSASSSSISDEGLDWGLGPEGTPEDEFDSRSGKLMQIEYQGKLAQNPNSVVDPQDLDEKCSNRHLGTTQSNEEFRHDDHSEHECDEKNVATDSNIDDRLTENRYIDNSSGGSLMFTEDDEGSDITDTLRNSENRLEDDDEKTVSNGCSDDDDLKYLDLPSKYSEELSEIFHMEINSVDYLTKVIQGYYSDWKGIRDALVTDKDLLLTLAPSHYESYLKNTVLDESKPFSLGFAVLIGQCIHSLLQEFKKKLSLITEQDRMINELQQKGVEHSARVQAENAGLSGKITELEEEISFLKVKNKELCDRIEKEAQEKEHIDCKRLEYLETERNDLIERVNLMIAEKDESKIEVEKLHDHISNLTSIIEGYQAEEEQINSRYEIELERARSQERKLQSRLSVLDSCQDEIHSLKGDISRLEEDRSTLERRISELQENNENLLNSNEEIMKQLKEVKDEQKEFMIDKRFIIQIIQKHNQDGTRIKYRNDLFNLLCDAIGISEEDRSNLFAGENKTGGSNTRKNAVHDLNQGMGFADLFYNFLNSEVEENRQEGK